MSIAPEATKPKRKFVIETNVVVDNSLKEQEPNGIDEQRARDIVDEMIISHRSDMKRVINAWILYWTLSLSRWWSFDKDKKLKQLRSELEQQFETKPPVDETSSATTIVMIVISVLALLCGVFACLKAFDILAF